MHTLRTIALVGLFSLLFAASALAAAEPGDVGVFFDPVNLDTTLDIPPFWTFEYWVIGFDLGDLQAFEMSVDADPAVIVTGTAVVGAPGSICVGPYCGPVDWLVGLGQCVDGSGAHPLLYFTAILIDPLNDLPICVRPLDPSSFIPPAPGYVDCAANPVPLGVAENGGIYYADGCGVVNPTLPIPIATQETSWSGLKARFGN